MTEITEKVERAIARFDRVTQHLDEREGPTRAAARRERERLNAGLGRTFALVAVALVAIWLATAIIGFVAPIGMFGFVAALVVTIGVAGWLIVRGGRQSISAPRPTADLPNGPMVERFDSYLYRVRRSLPAAGQKEVDRISQLLPSVKQTLERMDTLDPAAQDARRLMSIHLPGLIDRYLRVPAAFRQEKDGEEMTVDQRLVEGLAAGRAALNDVAEQLARADMAALETQGRFIQARYGDNPQLVRPDDAAEKPADRQAPH